MLRQILINILISTNITSIKLIKHTKDINRAKDKAYIKKIIQRIHITEKDTREIIKDIKYFNKRSAMSMIS
jgi:hypothetical protein